MSKRLRIPASLAFSVSAAWGCGSSAELRDAAADLVMLVDAQDAQIATDVPRRCTPFPFDPTPGRLAIQCVARRGATLPCPRENVCLPEDCPAHCDGCIQPLACVPDNTVDAGVECVLGVSCRGDGCNPGCRAVS